MGKSLSFPANCDRTRKHRGATSRAMKAMAEGNRCPSCGRGAALRTVRDDFIAIRICRWCGWEKKVWERQ